MTLKALAAAVCMTLASASQAAVLDFNEVVGGFQGSPTVTLSNATISSSGPDSFVFNGGIFGTPANGGVCGISSGCSEDFSVEFTLGPVANLTFSTLFFNSGDNSTVTVFGGSTVLSTIAITGDQFLDFTGISGITSLFVDDSSPDTGFAYVDFEFEQLAPVPLPAGGLLLLSGLGGIAAFKRRKKRAA